MPRLMLSDEQWSKLKTIMLQEGIYDKLTLICPGKSAHRVYAATS